MLAEVMDEAQLPPGVFNLVIGKGRIVGEAMASHPDVDLISFTGSTNAGARVGEVAARTINRTSLELGGKSANIVLPDADLEQAARWNIQRCFLNTGQSCHAPSRMLVHESQMAAVLPTSPTRPPDLSSATRAIRPRPWGQRSVRTNSRPSSDISRRVWTRAPGWSAAVRGAPRAWTRASSSSRRSSPMSRPT
jgi:hypothetical protein